MWMQRKDEKRELTQLEWDASAYPIKGWVKCEPPLPTIESEPKPIVDPLDAAFNAFPSNLDDNDSSEKIQFSPDYATVRALLAAGLKDDAIAYVESLEPSDAINNFLAVLKAI